MDMKDREPLINHPLIPGLMESSTMRGNAAPVLWEFGLGSVVVEPWRAYHSISD